MQQSRVKAKTDEHGDGRKKRKEMWVSALCVSFFLSSCLSSCQCISHRTTTGPPEGRLKYPHMAWRRENEIDESRLQVVSHDTDLYHSSLCAKFALFIYLYINSKWRFKKARLLHIKLLDHSQHQNICFHHERDTICSLYACVFLICKRNASKRWFPKS